MTGVDGHRAPAEVVADLAALGIEKPAAARRLVGGRGDRTWRIDTDDGSWVLHRRAVDPGRGAGNVSRERRCTAAAAAVGVGPVVVAVDADRGLLLTRWIPGRALTPVRVAEPQVLAAVAARLRVLHGAAVPRHGVRTAALHDRYYSDALRADRAHSALLARTRPLLSSLAGALEASAPEPVLVHGDLVPGNIVWGARGPFLVDYEFAGAGEPAYDLGNLVAGCSLGARSTIRLVRGYCGASGPESGDAVLRVRAWSRVLQGAWIAWVARGQDLGTARAHWTAWADAAARSLSRAVAGGELRDLLTALE